MTVRGGLLACVLISGLVAGCASGPLGERPEATAPQAPDDASKVVAVTFDLRDGDRSICSVRVQYWTATNGEWRDATLVRAFPGAVTGKGMVSGLHPTEAYVQHTVLWDSWADDVGKGGADGEPVKLRITPSDGDGVGAPAVSAAPFTVDNWLAKMEIQPPASVTFEHGLKNALNPADGSFTIVDAVTAPVDLLWKITDISYSPGGADWITAPVAGVTEGTATAGGGTSDVTVSVDASPGGADLPPGVYTAIITVGDTNIPSAYGSPKTVTVTLTVSRPVMSLQPTSVTFDEVAWNLAPTPGNETFTIRNDGPAYTELYWVIDDSAAAWLTVTDPVAKNGMITGGGSQIVTLSADHMSPDVLGVAAHQYPLTVDDNAGAGVPSRTVDVTLPVRNQRPEILVHDGTGSPFPGDPPTLALTCVEGQTPSFVDAFWIRNVGEPVSELDWDIIESTGWLSCDPTSNAGPALALGADEPVTLDVDAAGLTPVVGPTNDYTATITVTGGDYTLGEPTVSGVDRQLVVELDVLLRGQLDLDPPDVSFTDAIHTVSYPVDEFVDVDLTNSGEVDLNWSGAWVLPPDWITVTGATSGTVAWGGSDWSTLRFTVNANANAINLPLGANTATFTYTNDDTGETRDLVLSLYVMAQAQLETSPTEDQDMYFDMALAGPATSSQDLEISNSGEAPLDWQVSEGADWLTLTNVTDPPCAATETDTVRVTVDRTDLEVGSYSAVITVSAAGATGTPKIIAVYLNIACQIGTGTTPWDFPMFTLYEDSRTQVIYLAGEVGGAITTNALSLYVTQRPQNSASTYRLGNWTIRMRQTDLDEYPASPSWESSEWTTVYQDDVDASGWALPAWIRFDFTTPFAYDGTSNLMVDFSHNNSSWYASGLCWSTNVSPAYRMFVGYSDSHDGDPLNWSGTGDPSSLYGYRERYALIPTIRLHP